MGMTEQELTSLVTQALSAPTAAAASSDPYAQARAEFATVATRRPSGTEGLVASIRGLASFTTPESQQAGNTGPEKDYLVSATGKIMYPNGAIFDPSTGRTLYPTRPKDAENIAGSEAWLSKIQDSWSDAKIAEWRKKLANQGYEVAEKGGFADDLRGALYEYHNLRYSNFGKPLAKSPMQDINTREAVRETVDFQSLKQEAKTWGQVPFGEDLSDDEADWLADKMVRKMVKLAKEHPSWTQEQVQTGAQARVMNQFSEEPQVKALVQEQEDQEVSYKIRDSIVGVSQLLGA